MADDTYNVIHKKTGRSVEVADAFKGTCDKHGYKHNPRIQVLGGIEFDKKGRIIGPDGRPVK